MKRGMIASMLAPEARERCKSTYCQVKQS
jgi:hypothetical protein